MLSDRVILRLCVYLDTNVHIHLCQSRCVPYFSLFWLTYVGITLYHAWWITISPSLFSTVFSCIAFSVYTRWSQCPWPFRNPAVHSPFLTCHYCISPTSTLHITLLAFVLMPTSTSSLLRIYVHIRSNSSIVPALHQGCQTAYRTLDCFHSC